jgi:hypothetical protein
VHRHEGTRPTVIASSVLRLDIHQLLGWHHVGVQVCHDPKRAGDDQSDYEHAECQRQHVVGIVRPGCDVQEEDEVDTHLATARTARPVVTPGPHSRDVLAAQKEVAVRMTASTRPIR